MTRNPNRWTVITETRTTTRSRDWRVTETLGPYDFDTAVATRGRRRTMGTPWITTLNQVCETIPPAYTQYIGAQLITQI